MSLRILLPLAFVAGLAACTGGTAWEKPGATEKQVRADQIACRRSSERATGRNTDVTRDIRTSIPGGREDTRAIVEDTRDLRAARSFERLFAQCMRGLGYVQAKN